MNIKSIALVLVVALALTGSVGCGSASDDSDDDGGSCCKVCTTGKACGNSCINEDFECHQPDGCACNG